MKIVGLIAEYNPFHNGHLYHIEKAKEASGADAAVVVMSGDYVQRGVPAILPMRLRAEMALKCGAAAVFELPVCYATGSAELFAVGAVSLLESLGIVDCICFGSECGSLTGLKKLADFLSDEPESYRKMLQTFLKQGMSFPAARKAALSACAETAEYAQLLDSPNNILGIEYLKALKKLHSPMTPCTIRRTGAGYHDAKLHTMYSSASAIRPLLANAAAVAGTESTHTSGDTDHDGIWDKLKQQIPDCCLELLRTYHQVSYPVFEDDFSLLLKEKLLCSQPDKLRNYLDVSKELANRICARSDEYIQFHQFCSLLKTRELTQTRISRALLHILLGIKQEDVENYIKQGYHFYAHLLGFRTDSPHIVSAAAKCARIPVITKLYQDSHLPEIGQQMLANDIYAANLYNSVITDKYQTDFQNEYRQPVLKIE